MNELYELIEKKIKESGYPRQISGADVYDDICDQIDGKENGTYLLLSKETAACRNCHCQFIADALADSTDMVRTGG